MPVPDYETLMQPMLELLADGRDYPIGSVRERLAEEFRLDEADLEQRLPSGRAKLFHNRLGWATTYLLHAGLIERPRRALYRITDRGRQMLDGEDRITASALAQFPEMQEFLAPAGGSQRVLRGEGEDGRPLPVATPDETIEAAYGQLRVALVEDLLERVMRESPEFFERLVLHVLRAIGYGGSLDDEAGEHLGRTGDEGLDGMIREDRLGLDVIYVQAKRWRDTVGRPTVQAFVGALSGARASKGVLLTTSSFTPDAHRFADTVAPREVLVDGRELAELMIDHDVGVSLATRYEIKKVDRDFFGETES